MKSDVQANKRFAVYSALTVVAAVIGIAADFILGFVDPGSLGRFSIVQEGWADISLWRPGISMLLAAIAFPVYLFGIHVVAERIAQTMPRISKVFWVLTVVSSGGGLLMHVFFCFPQYVYAYLVQNGQPEVALVLADKLLWMLFPAMLVYMVLIASCFGLLFASIISGRTPYSRFVAFLSPFTVAALFSALRIVLPESTVVLALTTASVHVAMLLLFAEVTFCEFCFLKKGGAKEAETAE